MKKILFLLLCTVSIYGQTTGQEQDFDYGIRLPSNPISTNAPFVNVQENSGVVNKISKSDLIEYIEVASAVNLPVTGVTSKLYLTRDNNRLYRWNGTVYAEVTTDISGKENSANKQNSLAVDGTGVKFPTVDAVNAKLPTSYTSVVYVNATSPTTATIFDTNNPPVTNNNALKLDVNNLYIGNDASTWVYQTSPAGYITKTVPPTSNFNLAGTSIDAGNNKTSAISRSGSLRVDNDITLATNLRSSTANLMLFDFNGIIFRSLRSNAWSDNLSSRFFQIGTTGDNVVFSTQSANNANRMLFASNATQFSSGNYLTTPAPLGIFEITNGVSRVFNAFSNGNITIGTQPITSVSTYDFITRNIATGVIEKIPSANIATTAFVTSADANNVKLTGFQEITGLKSFKPVGNSTGIQVVPTSGNGVAFLADLVFNSTAYAGFVADNNGTGFNYVGQNNGISTFTVDKFGVVTATGGTANNHLATRGQLLNNTLNKTANYTVLLTDFVNSNRLVITVDATSANITITLPNASVFLNYEVVVKKMDSSVNSVTITGNANIDGASTLVLSNQYSKSIVSSNSTQYIIL